jgi:hypothetical protein
VDGFDRGFDRDDALDRDKPMEAAAAGAGVVRGGEHRVAVETRTRGEAYADLRQAAESGWDRGRGFSAPTGELAAFRAERAGLPEVSLGEAARYIERHRGGRPWLETAERASPEALRIIVAADQGGGHGHIRHEGWVTEEAIMRRVAYLEDPAQLDPSKRHVGIDGLRPRDRHHGCADMSSRIADPDAFATALTRGAGHHDVRAALSTPYDRRQLPRAVLGTDRRTARQRRPQGVHRVATGTGGGKREDRHGEPPRVAGSDRGRSPAGGSRAEDAPGPDVRGRHDRLRHQLQQAAGRVRDRVPVPPSARLRFPGPLTKRTPEHKGGVHGPALLDTAS